eukprot:c23769_g1_i1 orf=398-1279(+)
MTDLMNATDNFDKARVIGDGGFGLVYEARLPDDRIFAVKKLSTDGLQGVREFQAEMETVGKIRHKNLVELVAYCVAGEDRVLVYRFMDNGSLDSWLHEREDNSHALDWGKRLRIVVGSAQGLAFLHHDCNPQIIHRDIKSSNILLDSTFEARISDFGLARIINPLASHVSTEAVGTIGYMAPEYESGLMCTLMADVYSFGILMLEVATGKRPNTYIKDRNLKTLVNWVQTLVEESEEEALLDPFMKDTAPPLQVKEYFRIACKCTVHSPESRPTMQEVAESLVCLEKSMQSRL